MPRKKNVQEEETQEEVVQEETQRVSDPLEDQPEDSPSTRAYRAMLRKYREQNPKKYEAKKEEFLKKLEGTISFEQKSNPNGVTRTTFQVPNIQSKKK